MLLYSTPVSKLFAQNVTNYAFSASSGTFTPLVSGTTNLGVGSVDDGAWNTNPLEFDFWYMGRKYTTLSASTNGWLAFGTTILSYGHENSLKTTATTYSTTIRPILAPLWDDLAISNVHDFSYQTTGTVGNRVFTAEFLNEEWQYPATTPSISFQVKLYENTGKIEFIYQSEYGSLHTPTASIGITGNESGSFLSLDGTGTSPTVSNSTETNNLSTRPANGQVYSFTPPVPADPGALTISAVTSSSMTLNWTDNSSNEVGFVIYRSTNNGESYEFVTQTAANATSSQQIGLSSNTVYSWKIYAVSEGALSANPIGGSQQTSACGTAVTRTWIGAGNGGSGTDVNQSSNWSPAGPIGCTDSLIMAFTSSATIALSSSLEVGAINASLSGSNRVFQLNTGANTLQINQSANFKISSGNGNTQMRINAESGGTIIYKSSATFSAAAGSNLPIYGIGGTTGTVKFCGNVNFESGCKATTTDQPSKVIFDAIGSQTITFNNTTGDVYLGNLATEIGSENSPTVSIAGSASGIPLGDLNINGNSTLDLGSETFNRFTSGGSINLASGSTLKLAASTGGQTGSNFPSNFTTYTFDESSNVVYNSTNAVNQTIYATASYGNLTLSNSTGSGSSIKTAGGNLTIQGDFTINDAFTIFNAGTSLNHGLKGNWINNGGINSGSFTYTTGNNITLNGTLPQQIQGSAATTFYDLTLDNTSGLVLAPSPALITTVTNILALTNGKVTLGNNELAIGANAVSGNITGYSSSNYIITNGTGALNQYNIGTGQRTNVTYPIGSAADSYTPIVLDLVLTTTVDNFKAAVSQNMLTDGITGAAYTSGVVNRTWDITEGIPGGSYITLSIQWNLSDELASFDRTNCTVSHYTSNTWTETSSKGAAGAGSAYTRTSGVISSFSPFAVTSSPGTLPIELIGFSGTCHDKNVLLEWETATETSNDYFTIEKSNNPRDFKIIGYMDGAGNSPDKKTYKFNDAHTYPEAAYYRLVQTDFDGHSTTSDIIYVNECNVDKTAITNIYNGSGVLTLHIYSNRSQHYDIFLFDVSGHKVINSERNLSRGYNEVEIASTAISTGIYLVLLQGDKTFISKKAILKN